MSVSNWMLVVGMLLTFGTLITFGFLAFNIVIVRRLWSKMEEFTTLCVQFKALIQDAEDNKVKTAKVYADALADKKYDVVDGKIALVPKSNEEVG